MKPGALFCSSDEEEENKDFAADLYSKTGYLWFMPINPDLDPDEMIITTAEKGDLYSESAGIFSKCFMEFFKLLKKLGLTFINYIKK